MGPQTHRRAPRSSEDSEIVQRVQIRHQRNKTQSPSDFSSGTPNARRQRNGILHLGGRGLEMYLFKFNRTVICVSECNKRLPACCRGHHFGRKGQIIREMNKGAAAGGRGGRVTGGSGGSVWDVPTSPPTGLRSHSRVPCSCAGS